MNSKHHLENWSLVVGRKAKQRASTTYNIGLQLPKKKKTVSQKNLRKTEKYIDDLDDWLKGTQKHRIQFHVKTRRFGLIAYLVPQLYFNNETIQDLILECWLWSGHKLTRQKYEESMI